MGQMTPLGDFGKSVAFLTWTHRLIPQPSGKEGERCRRRVWGVGWGGSGLPGNGVTLPALVCLLPFLRTSAASGIGESALPAGTRANTLGSRERDRPQKREGVPLAAQRRGSEPPSAQVLSQPAPGAATLEPSTPGSRDREGRGSAVPGANRSPGCAGLRGSAEPRASPSPARGPRAGMRGAQAAVAGRGLGGAGEGSRRREFEASYRQIEWQEPAVSLETADQ